MSTDKRKRNRVQGSWAAIPTQPRTVKTSHQSVGFEIDDCREENVIKGSCPAIGNIKYEDIDSNARHELMIQVLPKEPKMIWQEGEHVISTGPNGISRIKYSPHFIEPKEADWMFEQLYHELPWQQMTGFKDGFKFNYPRMVIWYGDHPYSYSKLAHPANTEWPPLLVMLRDLLKEKIDINFNSVLANLYRNEKDHVDWHSDDEKSLNKNPTIASLTFGAIRDFELRKKVLAMENLEAIPDSADIRIPLEHGSLIIMEGATQENWQHRIPKEYHSRKARVNLTFRNIYPE